MTTSVDLWTWTCARCDWKASDARTVNGQQAVAEALIRVHIGAHDKQAVAKDSAESGAPSGPNVRGVETTQSN
jgi:hypothetical protein